jgi:hypothetical protein
MVDSVRRFERRDDPLGRAHRLEALECLRGQGIGELGAGRDRVTQTRECLGWTIGARLPRDDAFSWPAWGPFRCTRVYYGRLHSDHNHSLSGRAHLLVIDDDVLRAPRVLEPGVLWTDARVVEPGRDGVRLVDLARRVVLKQVGAGAVQNAGGALLEGEGTGEKSARAGLERAGRAAG